MICSRKCLVPGLRLQALCLFLAAVLGGLALNAHLHTTPSNCDWRTETSPSQHLKRLTACITVFSQPLLAYSTLPAANFLSSLTGSVSHPLSLSFSYTYNLFLFLSPPPPASGFISSLEDAGGLWRQPLKWVMSSLYLSHRPCPLSKPQLMRNLS